MVCFPPIPDVTDLGLFFGPLRTSVSSGGSQLQKSNSRRPGGTRDIPPSAAPCGVQRSTIFRVSASMPRGL